MTDRDLLTLTQWLSPAFPLGAFAYSHALELAVSEGRVREATELQDWLAATLRFGAGRVDAALLAMTRQGAEAAEMAALAEALAGTRERWAETFEQGTAFMRTVAQMGGPEIPASALPVAVGVAARPLSLATRTVVSLYLHGFTSNLVSAGVRFVPLGQAAGQRVLAALHPVIAEVAEAALDTRAETLTTGSFAADLSSARHEDMDVRIFKT
ncbi:urease accessory protein UreF [Celeribacter indicus]|uniref:Urease accessory protein UreF n=1 Tax=Celeribacter indicus TaxID=1208324 RepID=A0A0B5E408_9RHOB|nr:urease accessory UreF family protein [Celeribacter indicus]AJE48105.1 urease accessory protein UreF [Celeribacter indicus]SDW32722.1 urease accessory protein [Celeribacter indicus]